MKRLLLLFIIFYSCKTEIITNSYNSNLNSGSDGYVSEKAIVKSTRNSTVLYFIRHAEVAGSESNPDLSEAGKKRAKSFVTFFEDKKIDSIFTTNFKRTLQTITPVAKSKNITPIYYDPNTIEYANFGKQNRGKNILIVGHSNTTPNFVNELIGKMKYSQMVDENHSDIFKVVLNGNKVFEEVLVLEVEMQKIAKAKALIEKQRLKEEKKKARKKKRKGIFD